tara:strand:- start:112 stop:453 length:342 start_codon:yes stop_codon:yes gene_type:complete
MKLPPLKYWIQPVRIRWFIMSLMKKYLVNHGENINKPLTKVELFEITRRVVNSQKCFELGYCEKCNCNMVDSINMKSYYCKHGCFPVAMETNKELEEYLKYFKHEFKDTKTKI